VSAYAFPQFFDQRNMPAQAQSSAVNQRRQTKHAFPETALPGQDQPHLPAVVRHPVQPVVQSGLRFFPEDEIYFSGRKQSLPAFIGKEPFQHAHGIFIMPFGNGKSAAVAAAGE
jgi:hypothetical protein